MELVGSYTRAAEVIVGTFLSKYSTSVSFFPVRCRFVFFLKRKLAFT